MGAADFYNEGLGKTPEEAFGATRDRAAWEHGHGGYTGTIAEKYDFMLIERPARVTARALVDTIAQAWSDEKAKAKLAKWYPHTHERIFATYDDKWGPCLAVEADPALTKKVKERYEGLRASTYHTDMRGREIPGSRKKLGPSARGQKVYVFFGTASS